MSAAAMGRAAVVALCMTFVVDCADRAAPDMGASSTISVTDDAGRTVELARPARRVLSLVPAGTEALLALGAGGSVVGRTRYDVDPRVADLPSVGGGLDPSLEAIVALHPDLVIAFESAGSSKVRPRIEELGIPVFAIQTQDTADIYRALVKLGRLTGRDAAADSLVASIRGQLAATGEAVPPGPRPRVLYIASIDPPIVAGPRTYVAELLGVAGADLVPATSPPGSFYPPLSLEEIVRQQPDLVMLPVTGDSAAALARLRREPGWRDLDAVRQGRVAIVPANLMDRPGARIDSAARLMRGAIESHWSRR